ncbi:hypothetical protein KQ878_01675 [Mycoplasma zalophidermidis]|uniref:Type I restriction modification DNA specificity domain-containing protein n=1 Tax=Mycoplasma zalophidermidis TaxID=398174 RepID=A0ABS6DSL3_9MOLU|nr:hypothetical protein [Mycoplasma zalophidermidis]MBU4689691.1 hypothetical protein [Mycoplasma zalophidermidis]MBU4693590.1 hypothetical protein [Mycoplasma zalophidermidis]
MLGKGGLKQLIGKTEKFTLYKLEQNFNYLWFVKQDNNKFYNEEVIKTSDNTYFSNSGIWLFASNAEKSISNFKLVLIKENSNPQSFLRKMLFWILNRLDLFEKQNKE